MNQIVVMQRGFVAVGEVARDGNDIVINNAAIIRRWGTTRGLGEIAHGGPTRDTILDKCPPIRCHELTVCFYMSCNPDKWRGVLDGRIP